MYRLCMGWGMSGLLGSHISINYISRTVQNKCARIKSCGILKIMKLKNIFVGGIIVMVLFPQITFASWWNPISWFNSWSFNDNEKVLEERTQELEKELNTEKESDINLESLEPQIKDEILVPIDDNTPVVEDNIKNSAELLDKTNYVTCLNKTINDTCSEEGMVFFCGPDQYGCMYQYEIDQLVICNGVTYGACPKGSHSVCPAQGESSCVKDASTDDSFTNFLNDLDSKEQEKKDAEEELKNSSDCRDAEEELEDLKDDYENIWDKYIDASGTSDSGKYSSKLADISIKQSSAQNEVYKYCHDYIPSSSGKVYNTTCTNFGGTYNCTTY